MVGGATLELAMRNKLGNSISPIASDSVPASTSYLDVPHDGLGLEHVI